MNKRVLFVILLALVALVVVSIPVLAAKPTLVEGKFAYAGPPTNIVMRQAGDNCIIDADLVYRFYDGALDGFAPFHFRIVSHGPCPAGPFDNTENLKARGTFDGTVNGKPGTLVLNYEAKGWPADPGELALTGRITILSGTGSLRNLHGVLNLSYLMGDDYDTYAGQLHFDPSHS